MALRKKKPLLKYLTYLHWHFGICVLMRGYVESCKGSLLIVVHSWKTKWFTLQDSVRDHCLRQWYIHTCSLS